MICLTPESLITILQRVIWETAETKVVEYTLIPKSLSCHRLLFYDIRGLQVVMIFA